MQLLGTYQYCLSHRDPGGLFSHLDIQQSVKGQDNLVIIMLVAANLIDVASDGEFVQQRQSGQNVRVTCYKVARIITNSKDRLTLGRDGGADGTRTRDPRRDRPVF